MDSSNVKDISWKVLFSLFVLAMLIAAGFIFATNAAFLGFHDFFYYIRKSRTILNLFTTAWTSTVATACSVLIGLPVGYFLSRYRLPCHGLMKTLIDLPIMVPPAAIGVFLLGIFSTPPMAGITRHLGIKAAHAPAGVVVAQFAVTVSFCIRLVMSSFDAVSPRYEAVSRSLGASLPRTFIKVSLPLAKKGIIAAVIVVWARAAAEWESLMLFVGGIQGRTDVMPFAVFLDWNGGIMGWALTTSIFCIFIAVFSMYAVRSFSGRSY